MIKGIYKPYMIFVNGILAKRTLTRARAIQVAMEYFPSYVVDARTNSVIWTGGN